MLILGKLSPGGCGSTVTGRKTETLFSSRTVFVANRGGHAQLASSSGREQTWRGRQRCVSRMKRGNAPLSTPGPERGGVLVFFFFSLCLSERLPTSSREPGSGRCLAPTAGPALLTVDKQVGPGVGESERTTGRRWWCTPPFPAHLPPAAKHWRRNYP